ncbi:acyltransferase family protein [Silvibacterium sp.]|uniref:acyltransferase family protein n=1 Tax=Silvibacterium sp. TaxID=1964179 RepID=UPI0039E58BF7
MNKRILELDGLRAIAILLVFGVHYRGFSSLFWKLPTYGWVGVDIFFALSGYLITRILLSLRHKNNAYTTFYSRRMIRIAPPYLVATLAVLLLSFVARHALAPGAFLFHQAFFLQAFYSNDFHFLYDLLNHPRYYLTHIPSLIPHLQAGEVGLAPKLSSATSIYWSLSVEEYFYILWAPIVLHFRRSIVIGFGIAVCIISAWIRLEYGQMAAYLSIITRFDALLYGALLAIYFDSLSLSRTRWIERGLQATAFVAAFAIALIVFAIHPVPGADVRQAPLFISLGLTFISIGAASIIGLLVLRSNSDWWLSRLLRTRPFQFIGTISYSMYLFHMIIAFVVDRAITATHKQPHEIIKAILSIGLTISMAWLSWHFIEKPLLRWKDRRFPAVKVAEPSLN